MEAFVLAQVVEVADEVRALAVLERPVSPVRILEVLEEHQRHLGREVFPNDVFHLSEALVAVLPGPAGGMMGDGSLCALRWATLKSSLVSSTSLES